MVATVAGIHLGIDTHANRPAANTVPDGSLYSCSTHSLVYKADATGNSWATWATLDTSGGSSTPPDHYEAHLGADVTLVNADQFYDGPSISLPDGDWEVGAEVTVTDANAGVAGIRAKLIQGATDFASRGGHKPAGSGVQYVQVVTGRVTLTGGPTTVKLAVASSRGSSSTVMKTTGAFTGELSNKATRIWAIAITAQ